MAVTTMICDDHALSALGLQHALEVSGGFEIVARAADGIEAIALARRLRPALAVLDYAMPRANGLEAHIEIRRWSPRTRTAILTARSDPRLLAAFAAQGVNGIFLKSQAAAVLIAGLARVAAGEDVHPAALPGAAGRNGPALLSARETEVLHKVAEGLSVRAIADGLGLSPKTVETHKASLMRKLGVNSTPALIVAAIKRKLIALD